MNRAVREFFGLLWALVIAIIIQTFLFQPFYVPSASMYPTLEVGDFFVASKFSYGYSVYSLPWYHPKVFSGRIWEGQPTVGQVLAFNGEPTSTDDYIKRCVGVPGDRVQMIQGLLHINGVSAKVERIDDYLYVDPRKPGEVKVFPQYIETLPNGVAHRIVKEKPFGEAQFDNTQEFVVPAGHYFMVGDNRDNSWDSRAMSPIGFVPAEKLIGPAQFLWFSTEAKWYEPQKWLTSMRFNRFFTWIR
ncbi:MAG: signal peptidase I [Alphaproteobacteria bacterium]|jgi:signal peptidase I|nr:signal peptidase I [Alphaproteobacteria bacterium]